MADKRPGGLTALAVLNFIFGGFGALGILGLLALLGAASTVANEAGAAEAVEAMSKGPIVLVLILSLVSSVLLIASGVGYLGQKQFLGRTLGNGYAVASILSSVIGLAMMDQGMGIGTIIGLIYPILTLVLLNTTFKEDLVN